MASRWSRYRSWSALASLTRPNSAPSGIGAAVLSWAVPSWASMSSSVASGSLIPPGPKNLIPLSLAGLWLAEMTTPKAAPSAPVR